ncbi:hypothetical protein F2Q69_00024635 [Brassica cretica]|uniref:DUF1216 domain-containing protein n=1 Tax=Brassica cretica TaxID=69181 RepID=A0A8S9Q9N0_BRACR|nr:hypothetical protein F2Q69_00024635 [Brassica cretica]
MEKYHQEVVKALQELETIHSKIISATQGKKDESVTVTAEQRTEIKQTITKLNGNKSQPSSWRLRLLQILQ